MMIREIKADCSYPLEDFRRLTGLGDHGFRAAKRRGLKVRRSGKRAYILGADWHRYLSEQWEADQESEAG